MLAPKMIGAKACVQSAGLPSPGRGPAACGHTGATCSWRPGLTALRAAAAQESLHYFKYKTAENVLYEYGDDIAPRHITAALPLDYDSVAAADKFCNVFITRLPAEVSAQARPVVTADQEHASQTTRVGMSGRAVPCKLLPCKAHKPMASGARPMQCLGVQRVVHVGEKPCSSQVTAHHDASKQALAGAPMPCGCRCAKHAAPVQVEDDPTGGKFAGAATLLNGAAHKLEDIINFHVGDLVTSLQRGTLQPGGQEALVYATVMGGVGGSPCGFPCSGLLCLSPRLAGCSPGGLEAPMPCAVSVGGPKQALARTELAESTAS